MNPESATKEISDKILYDDACNLCRGSVGFLQKKKGVELDYIPLSSPKGQEILTQVGLPSDYKDSLVLYQDGVAYTKTEAAIRILMKIGGLYNLFRILLWLPASWRDPVYDFVARNRIRWFGAPSSCEIHGRLN